MNANENGKIARAWIEFQTNWWAWDKLDELCRKDAEAAWNVLQKLVELAETPELIEDIGVGPLEDFINNYADDYIDRLEAAAGESASLKAALVHVQLRDQDHAVASRIVALGCKPATDSRAGDK